MTLAGKRVQFWFTPDGQREIGSLLRTEGPVEALVVDEDHLGVWIWFSPEAGTQISSQHDVLLVKWGHFSTAATNFEIPTDRPSVGFKS